MTNIQPIGERLFVRIQQETETLSGIVLPEIARDRHDYRIGVVAAAHEESEVKKDQRVLLDFGGGWTRIDGELLAVVKEDNLLAIIE